MKIFRLLVVLFVCTWFIQEVSAQLRTKYFFVGVALGATNYKGDLDDNFTLKFTKPGVGLVGAYKFHPHMYVRLSLLQGWMKASDKNARDENDPRWRRNLSFRSSISEAAITLHYEFFANHRKFKYRPRQSPYIFGGIAVFAFKPQAKIGGDWVDLQPLGTEGQFLSNCPTCPEPYSLVQVAIPFGVGLRYRLTDKLDLHIEMGLRKTFTDYIDDVSSEYPDLQQLAAEKGRTAALLSDRIDRAQYPFGAAFHNGIRGDETQQDWYVFSVVSATYILDWVKCPKFR